MSALYVPNVKIFIPRVDQILCCMNINGYNFCSRATRNKNKKKKQNTREHSRGKTHVKILQWKFSNNAMYVWIKENEIYLSKEPIKINGVYLLYGTWVFRSAGCLLGLPPKTSWREKTWADPQLFLYSVRWSVEGIYLWIMKGGITIYAEQEA